MQRGLMVPIKDMAVGDYYGRWMILKLLPCDSTKSDTAGRVLARCECGTERIVKRQGLRNGRSKSCGCLKREKLTTHAASLGGKITPEYSVWLSMKTRCYNSGDRGYSYWGGKGITVCDRWLHSFENFLADIGPRPGRNYTIDRIDNSRGYFKENCRWATRKQQANNRTNNHWITWNGRTQNLTQWGEEFKIDPRVLYAKLKVGRSIDDILRWRDRRGGVPSKLRTWT